MQVIVQFLPVHLRLPVGCYFFCCEGAQLCFEGARSSVFVMHLGLGHIDTPVFLGPSETQKGFMERACTTPA